MSTENSEDVHNQYEPNPDPHALTSDDGGRPGSVCKDVDYEPHPDQSLKVSPEHQAIIDAVTSLYCGSASEKDMQVYAEKSIYDDPWSYCDTRYKIAGQWYGIPKLFSPSKTLKTQVVSDTPTEIVFKMRQQYTPKVIKIPKFADSLISLSLDESGKVKYHKDMWNEKDYSHQGFGKLVKTLNGDHLTKITQPPESLKASPGEMS